MEQQRIKKQQDVVVRQILFEITVQVKGICRKLMLFMMKRTVLWIEYQFGKYPTTSKVAWDDNLPCTHLLCQLRQEIIAIG